MQTKVCPPLLIVTFKIDLTSYSVGDINVTIKIDLDGYIKCWLQNK